jgi:hypothetical protein
MTGAKRDSSRDDSIGVHGLLTTHIDDEGGHKLGLQPGSFPHYALIMLESCF